MRNASIAVDVGRVCADGTAGTSAPDIEVAGCINSASDTNSEGDLFKLGGFGDVAIEVAVDFDGIRNITVVFENPIHVAAFVVTVNMSVAKVPLAIVAPCVEVAAGGDGITYTALSVNPLKSFPGHDVV